MKSFLLAALASVALAAPAFAQGENLAPFNAAGVTYGHVHLTTADPAAMQKLWVDQFGAVMATKGTFTIAKIPGMEIAFRKGTASGSNQGLPMDHFGLKVPDLQAALTKWKAAGYTVDREFKGSEGFPNAFISGPDSLRIELQEDKTIKVPTAYHLHFRVKDPIALRDWYVKTFGLTPGKVGNFDTAEAPGMRLIFQKVDTDPAPGNSRDHSVDHIGFEVKGLKAFDENLAKNGVTFETPYREVPAIGLNISYIYDPLGTYIEITEGYTGY